MTEAQKKFLALSKEIEALKEKQKGLHSQMSEAMNELGVGVMFQDPETNLVYEIVVPTGTYVEYRPIGYVRTKKPEEKTASLSAKRATEAGFKLK